LGRLAEEHSNELIPASEAFGVSLSAMLMNDIGKFVTIEQSKYLAE